MWSSTHWSEFSFPVEVGTCHELIMTAVQLEIHVLNASLRLLSFVSSSENGQ